MSYLDKIINKLQKKPLNIDQFRTMLQNSDTFFENVDLEIELLISNGFPIKFTKDTVYLETSITNIEDQVFCIVDIETTSSKASTGQIIEIGAVKYKNKEIIDSYKSLVNANDFSVHIQKLTSITPDMLKDAPSLKIVIEEFKIFLDNNIFVAHDINFDYKFISDTMEQFNLGKLCNRKICTIKLAKKTIQSPRYGLDHLRELFCINTGKAHRAFSDALSATIVFEKCIEKLPNNIRTSEDLINFSLHGTFRLHA